MFVGRTWKSGGITYQIVNRRGWVQKKNPETGQWEWANLRINPENGKTEIYKDNKWRYIPEISNKGNNSGGNNSGGNRGGEGGGIGDEWDKIAGLLSAAQDTYRKLANEQMKKLRQELKQQEWLFQHYKGMLPQYEGTINDTLGLLSQIQNEYKDVVDAYKQGVQAAITGNVPPEIKQKLEAIRQAYIQQGRGSMQDYYNQMERRYIDTLASKGILQSKPAADILSSLRKEELNKLADQVNQANMMYAKGMLEEPYKALQAIGSEGQMVLGKTKIPLTKVSTALAKLKPSSTLSGLLAQASQYPIAITKIGQTVEQLPLQNIQYESAKTNAYTQMIRPLIDIWQAQQQMELAQKQMKAQDDASMWGFFGSLVPFIFGGGGLFG